MIPKRKMIIVTDQNLYLCELQNKADKANTKTAYASSYYATEKVINEKVDVIYTNQITFLQFAYTLPEYGGYELFLRKGGKDIKIEEGMSVHRGKELRFAHNLYKIFMTGGFNQYFEETEC